MPITGMNKPLQQGLVLWLKMSEGVGSVAHDISEYRNNGTIYGTSWVVGHHGSALSFNGTSDYVYTSNAFNSAADSSWTLACWIKLLQTYTDNISRTVISIPNSSNICISSRNNYLVPWLLGSTPFGYTDPGQLATQDLWYHTIFTMEGGVIGRQFMNGVEILTADPIGAAPVFLNMPARVGGDGVDGSTNLNAVIDDVRIYNRVISAYEGAKLYRERGYV